MDWTFCVAAVVVVRGHVPRKLPEGQATTYMRKVASHHRFAHSSPCSEILVNCLAIICGLRMLNDMVARTKFTRPMTYRLNSAQCTLCLPLLATPSHLSAAQSYVASSGKPPLFSPAYRAESLLVVVRSFFLLLLNANPLWSCLTML